MIVVIIVCVLLLLIIRSRNGTIAVGAPGDAPAGNNAQRKTLSFDSILTMKKAPFNTQYIGNKERLSVKDGVLTLRYAKNAHAGSSGAKISALPSPLPSEKVEFGYDVLFPPSFEWVKGGKLPGVCLGGTNSKECATGGDWKVGQGSVRPMWRSKNGKDAYIIAYVYLPVGGNPSAAYKRQGKGYQAATDPGERTGHNVWTGELPIKKGWNSIRFRLVMNTPKKTDGVLEIEVNGKTRSVNDVCYRDTSSVNVNNLNFVSFYGGSGSDWNSPQHETSTSYKNFWIS